MISIKFELHQNQMMVACLLAQETIRPRIISIIKGVMLLATLVSVGVKHDVFDVRQAARLHARRPRQSHSPTFSARLGPTSDK